ncbi:lactadherin-like [Amphiura filiformis]|uniref:lactadherin-like n=1 Tax=Amphiura filiformis TaxID=82378 RepID=UPI003B20FAAD
MSCRHAVSTLVTAIVFSLVLYTSNAITCFISKQPDPNRGNKLRWFLSDTLNDRCTCTKILFGGQNTVSKEGLEKRFYIDNPLQFVNNDDPDSLRQLLDCKDEYVTSSKTTNNTAASPKTTTNTVTSPKTTTMTATIRKTTINTAISSKTTTNTTTSPKTATMTATSPRTTTKTATSHNTITMTTTSPKTNNMTTVETSDSAITEKVTVTQHTRCSSGQIAGCTTPHALGMESHDIKDRRIAVSSRGTYKIINSNTNTIEQKHSAQRVRLDHGRYWVPDSSDTNPWVQVYVGFGKRVSGIIIQGFKQHWIHHDFIKVQINGRNFESVNSSLESAWIDDPESHTTLMFERPVITSVIRVQPQDCMEITKDLANGNQITISDCALRMEILGCENTQECGCVKPLGMESQQIYEGQIFVSYNIASKNFARLHNGSYWDAPPSNSIGVTWNQKVNISGIIIQGSGDQWVERCIIEADSSPMFGSQEFEANFDGDAPVSIIFEEPVETSYIIVTPTVCPGNYCKLRMEILGPCMSG